MSYTSEPNLGLFYGWGAGENGWGGPMNENLKRLGAVVQIAVLDKDLAAPPGWSGAGDRYIVAPEAIDAWAGHDGEIAVYQDDTEIGGTISWLFIPPHAGWRCYVVDEALFYYYNGTDWVVEPAANIELARRTPINAQTGTTYTLAVDDAGCVVRINNAAAITVTLPDEATEDFAVGDSVALRQVGDGQITITPAAGVTLNIPDGYLAATGRKHATIMLHKVGADEWDLTGDLAPDA